MIDFSEFNKEIIARCKASVDLTDLVGDNIYTSLPQDVQMPYVYVQFDLGLQNHTKSSQHFNSILTFIIWSDQRSPKEADDILTVLNELFHRQILTLTSGQNYCLEYNDSKINGVQPDLSISKIIEFSVRNRGELA